LRGAKSGLVNDILRNFWHSNFDSTWRLQHEGSMPISDFLNEEVNKLNQRANERQQHANEKRQKGDAVMSGYITTAFQHALENERYLAQVIASGQPLSVTLDGIPEVHRLSDLPKATLGALHDFVTAIVGPRPNWTVQKEHILTNEAYKAFQQNLEAQGFKAELIDVTPASCWGRSFSPPEARVQIKPL
jgi:hypothetical protein